MLSFEVSAIDIVLAIGVAVLLLLYMNKFSTNFPDERHFRKKTEKDVAQKTQVATSQIDHTECPRGFGNIKKLGEDNSVSEKCLSCYKLMHCYGIDQ